MSISLARGAKPKAARCPAVGASAEPFFRTPQGRLTFASGLVLSMSGSQHRLQRSFFQSYDCHIISKFLPAQESVTLYSDLVLAVAFAKMSSFAFLKDFFPKMYRDTGSGEGFGHERTGRLKPRPSSTSFLSKVNSSLCGCMSDVCSLGAEFAE